MYNKCTFWSCIVHSKECFLSAQWSKFAGDLNESFMALDPSFSRVNLPTVHNKKKRRADSFFVPSSRIGGSSNNYTTCQDDHLWLHLDTLMYSLACNWNQAIKNRSYFFYKFSLQFFSKFVTICHTLTVATFLLHFITLLSHFWPFCLIFVTLCHISVTFLSHFVALMSHFVTSCQKLQQNVTNCDKILVEMHYFWHSSRGHGLIMSLFLCNNVARAKSLLSFIHRSSWFSSDPVNEMH